MILAVREFVAGIREIPARTSESGLSVSLSLVSLLFFSIAPIIAGLIPRELRFSWRPVDRGSRVAVVDENNSEFGWTR